LRSAVALPRLASNKATHRVRIIECSCPDLWAYFYGRVS
jgi:hypothetical protein